MKNIHVCIREHIIQANYSTLSQKSKFLYDSVRQELTFLAECKTDTF